MKTILITMWISIAIICCFSFLFIVLWLPLIVDLVALAIGGWLTLEYFDKVKV